MADNYFGSDDTNMSIENVKGYIDDTGLLRIKTPSISSYNFDGVIPSAISIITASALQPGMKVSFTGSADANIYYNILSVLNEDDFVTGSALSSTYIEYLDDNSELQSVTYGASSSLPVLYEDWDEKYLGTRGWYISNEGNAIFSNVAVRGRVEATEGSIEGNLELGGALTASTNNGQIIISSSGIFGSTSSGSIEVNTINGNIEISGNITVDSGFAKELIVGEEFFPIGSITGYSGSNLFIMIIMNKLDPL